MTLETQTKAATVTRDVKGGTEGKSDEKEIRREEWNTDQKHVPLVGTWKENGTKRGTRKKNKK